jgi:hypothetical protein
MRIHNEKEEELYKLLNIQEENIIYVCRDNNHLVIKIILNDFVIIEEFETCINKKFLASIPIIKKLEKESFEYLGVIDFVFALKMFVQSFCKKCDIKNVEYVSTKINHKLHF